MKLAANLEDFEGLIFKTTGMVMPLVEETDFSEVQQLLRIKVWKAYETYDPARSKLPLKGYVFGCLMNYVKDLKKQAKRARVSGRTPLFIEDIAPHKGEDGGRHDGFHGRYLAVAEEETFLSVVDEVPLLPNTLNDLERRVIGLLVLDYSLTEISRTLGVGPKRLRAIRRDIRDKMADWKPTAEVVPERLLEAA